MLDTDNRLHPKVVETLGRWHGVVENKDMDTLADILHPQAVFRSPMAFKGYESAQAVILVLSNVIEVFEDFTYHRSFAGDDGLS